MAIFAQILSTLQKARQTLTKVQRELTSLASAQSRSVQNALSGKGSAAQADTYFQDWKQSAQMAHELKDINERLAGLHAIASGAGPASVTKTARSRKQRVKPSRSRPAAEGPPVLRGNNAKLMSVLEGLLSRDTCVGVTQAQMSEGASIPLGSVAYSVGRLVGMNVIEEGQTRGTYRLL